MAQQTTSSSSLAGSMWWLTTCWVVFTAELAFSITVITDSIQAKQVRWNLFATEEGRYVAVRNGGVSLDY